MLLSATLNEVVVEDEWHIRLRWTGSALIAGTGLLLIERPLTQIAGAVVFLTANAWYLARWYRWAHRGNDK